jgi:hypothetical protein
MTDEDIKLENVISPTEMFARFGEIGDFVNRNGDIYIDSFHFAAELLRTAHEGIDYESLARNIPHVYRKIVEKARNYEGQSFWDVVSGRRLEKSNALLMRS